MYSDTPKEIMDLVAELLSRKSTGETVEQLRSERFEVAEGLDQLNRMYKQSLQENSDLRSDIEAYRALVASLKQEIDDLQGEVELMGCKLNKSVKNV
jgi:predicted RNase H-like nuclease (RuvC/YqgF family)